jgi:hypothetical protein
MSAYEESYSALAATKQPRFVSVLEFYYIRSELAPRESPETYSGYGQGIGAFGD